MNPKISIIVPIFNSQKHLAETIQTVLNQTYSNWELLLIDDGSVDESSKICNKYLSEDSRILYFYKDNGGQATARNLGIKKSSGSWVAMLDSDDLWEPRKLEKQVNIISSDANIECCFTNTSAFKGSIANEIENNDKYRFGLFQNKLLFKTIYHQNYIANSSVMIKKNLFEKIGHYDENPSIIGSEDWDLILRILKHDSLTFGIEEKLLFYRLHDGGVHNQSIKMLNGKIHVYSKYDNDSEIPNLLRLKQYRYVYRELMNFLWLDKKEKLILLKLKEFGQKDKIGIATIKQRLMIKILPLPLFMWVSQKIIYRISYRLESITYFLFLK